MVGKGCRTGCARPARNGPRSLGGSMPGLPKELCEGYNRFRRDYLTRHRAYLERLAREGQHPHTLFVACPEGTVVPEIMLDARPGDIFTEVNIANQVHRADSDASSAGAAVVFAVKYLKVSHVVVCGHYNCGGVAAVLAGLDAHEGEIRAWLSGVLPIADKTAHLRDRLQARWDAAVEENVMLQLGNLKTHECVQKALSAGRLWLHAWVCDLRGGILVLNPETNRFEAVPECACGDETIRDSMCDL
ncbi:MAG: carbonic anhydrase [Elusimicrobiota bacterium]